MSLINSYEESDGQLIANMGTSCIMPIFCSALTRMLERKSYNETHPRVEYNLTDKSQELIESIINLLQWMRKWNSNTWNNFNCLICFCDFWNMPFCISLGLLTTTKSMTKPYLYLVWYWVYKGLHNTDLGLTLYCSIGLLGQTCQF